MYHDISNLMLSSLFQILFLLFCSDETTVVALEPISQTSYEQYSILLSWSWSSRVEMEIGKVSVAHLSRIWLYKQLHVSKVSAWFLFKCIMLDVLQESSRQ